MTYKKEHEDLLNNFMKILNMKKLSKTIILVIIIAVVSLTAFILFKNEILESKTRKICCNNNCFNIEIADDTESRQLWLMYRESLWLDEWMLFVYNEPWPYSFWMKNTLIPLAWIRLDSDLKIVDIILMDPCKTDECPSYKPQSQAQYVLEINQWLISEKWLLNVWNSCELINS